MEYLIINIKILSAFFLLIMLPGLLLMRFLKESVTNLDTYEKASFSLVIGMAFWIPIAWVSFGLGLSSKLPIYLSMSITTGLIFLSLFKSNFNLRKLFPKKESIYNYINIYTVIIIIQALFIGYTSQYQTGNSDALAHLAGLRNLATSEVIFNCDHVLGSGSLMPNTYGCNPWYLSLAMVIKFSAVDAALVYSIITGIIYFMSVLAIYSLLKAISGNVLVSKFGSIIFTIVSLMIWLIANNNTTYNLSMHWMIFPQAIVSYVLFPVMLAAFIQYILHRDNLYLALMIICLFAVTRFHPNWLIWAPIIISGIIIGRNLTVGKNKLNHKLNYNLIYIYGIVSILSAASFLLCENTFKFDPTTILPLDLWRVSGGNLLFLYEDIYLYNPLSYLKSRGWFDLITVLLLWYIYSKGRENANEILVFFIVFLLTIFLIIFNPLIVVPFVKISGTPIPIYRAFELMWPSLSAVTIYAALVSIQIKSKELPKLKLISIIIAVLFSILFFTKYASFLVGVYKNEGEHYDETKSPPYYSTNKSPFLEPFSTLRTLDGGKVAVRTPLATAVAALTNLDPLTTEWFRYASPSERKKREHDNNMLLSFNGTQEELLSLLKTREIRYIVISSTDSESISNFKKYPDLVHFKATAGSDEVWEVNNYYD